MEIMDDSASADFTPPQLRDSEYGLSKSLDPLPIPPVISMLAAQQSLKITMSPTSIKLNFQLPPTHVWTYNEGYSRVAPEVERYNGRDRGGEGVDRPPVVGV
jgi:hypothetical protein